MGNRIEPIFMPKWGMSMKVGLLLSWLVEEGEGIDIGQEIAEIETEKTVTNLEAGVSGILRKKVVSEGEQAPIRSLIGVVADPSITESEIADFVSTYVDSSKNSTESSALVASRFEKIQIGGKYVNYLKQGEANERRVLLLHGFGGDLNSWQFNHRELSSCATVYALDLLGHGKSSKDVGVGDYDAMSSIIFEFIQTLELGKVHLVGHSLGGAISLYLSNRHPEIVASLTLIASIGVGSTVNEQYICNYINARTSRELRAVLEEIFFVKKKLSRTMVEQVLRYKRIDGVNGYLEIIAKNCLVSGVNLLRDTSKEKVKPFACQFIWGAEDRVIQPPKHESISPASDFHTIQGAGHMVHIEKSRKVNRLITNFIL